MLTDSGFPIIVLHNVSSASRCSEFVKIASGMGFKTLVITQAQGTAAQRGLPSAQKIALKNKVNFIPLFNLDDVIELFNPEEMVLVAPPPYGKVNLTQKVIDDLEDKKIAIVFGGNDPGLSRKDLEKGDKVVQIPVGDLGSLGMITLGLALFTKKFGFRV